ncbi:MAG TPA: AMP-binding protein [Kofleriaceae bacterium]
MRDSIIERFRQIADRHSEHIAICAGDREITYRALHAEARRGHAALQPAVTAGDRVAIVAPGGIDAVAAALAVAMHDATFVPLDPRWPDARLAQLIAAAEVRVVVTTGELRARVAGLVPPGVHVIAGGRDALEVRDAPRTAPTYLMFTSGSTGTPKAVVQHDAGVLFNIDAYAAAIGAGPGERLASVASFACDGAIMDVFGAVLHGATLCVFELRQHGAEAMAAWLAAAAITVLHCTPTVLRHLCRAAGGDLPALRRVVLGGEEPRRDDIAGFRRRFGGRAVVVNGFGPTECTVALQHELHDAEAGDPRRIPLGAALPGVELVLVDAAGAPGVGPGPHELVLRSPGVAAGYWRDPELTEAAFPARLAAGRGRAFRTGDLVTRDADGTLRYAGRADRRTKLRGHRVEPIEIEAMLERHPGVRAAAVVEPDAPGPERLVGYVVAPGHELAAIRAWLAERLPRELVPAELVALDALPLSAGGKTDRAALARRAPAESGDASDAAPNDTPNDAPDAAPSDAPDAASRDPLDAPSRDQIAAAVARIWRRVLGIELGLDDIPRAAGTDSLDGLRAAALIDRELGYQLEPFDLLDTCPRDLALRICAEVPRASDAAPLAPALARCLASPSQRRYLARCAGGDRPELHVCSVIDLPAHQDADAIHAALRALIAHHDVLRARFAADGELLIERDAVVPVDIVGITELTADARARAIRAARIACDAPFVLDQAPLLRACLVQFPTGDSALVLAMHHLITDTWSRQVLERDLVSLLAHAPLAPAPSYPAFASWQHTRRPAHIGEFIARHQLSGLVADRLQLPAGPATPGRHVVELGAAARRALDAACRRHAVTPFVLLLAALVPGLRAWSATGRVVVTTDHANRDEPGFERLVGLAADVLPIAIPADVAADVVGADVAAVDRATRDALARRALPFADLVDAIAPGELARYDLAFPVGFFVETAPSLAGPRSRMLDADDISRPLIVVAQLAPDAITLDFERRRGWLDDDQLAALAAGTTAALHRLLEGSR